MKLSISFRYLVPVVAFILAFGMMTSPALADHHEEEAGHMEVDVAAALDSGATVEQMQTLISVLQQLVALLSQQVEISDHIHMDMDDHASNHLVITAMEHGGVTHIHVQEPDKDETTFFLEDVPLSDEDGVIDAVMDETGFSHEEVHEAIKFESDESMEADHDHADEEDLSGIHIMPDGSVMLGDGSMLPDATVTEDGMILLPDGDLVEPVMDLR